MRRELAGSRLFLWRGAPALWIVTSQADGAGFPLVEILSPCPTYWGVEPLKALKWIEEKVIPRHPLGVIKDAPARTREA